MLAVPTGHLREEAHRQRDDDHAHQLVLQVLQRDDVDADWQVDLGDEELVEAHRHQQERRGDQGDVRQEDLVHGERLDFLGGPQAGEERSRDQHELRHRARRRGGAPRTHTRPPRAGPCSGPR